jgi:Flp pilus assembly protein TadG
MRKRHDRSRKDGIAPVTRRGERGNTIVEMAILTPVMVMLLIGMVQFAEITYTYYTLRKIVYSTASYLSSQQGVDFCGGADPEIAAAINVGLTGTTDGSQPAIVGGLTADMIQVTAEDSGGPYAGCGFTVAPAPPAFITVSIPNGYPFQIFIPFFPTFDPIALKPQVKTPYGGT